MGQRITLLSSIPLPSSSIVAPWDIGLVGRLATPLNQSGSHRPNVRKILYVTPCVSCGTKNASLGEPSEASREEGMRRDSSRRRVRPRIWRRRDDRILDPMSRAPLADPAMWLHRCRRRSRVRPLSSISPHGSQWRPSVAARGNHKARVRVPSDARVYCPSVPASRRTR